MTPPESRFVLTNPQGSAVAGRDGNRTVVWLNGEHDTATVADLSVVLVRACAADADLVVDLSDVQFMDASTIGVIIRARNVFLSRSRSLSLRSPVRCARRVLDACGLAELIDSDPQRAETAGALGSWVAIPASDRGEHRVDESAPASAPTATLGQSERAGEGATVPATRRRP